MLKRILILFFALFISCKNEVKEKIPLIIKKNDALKERTLIIEDGKSYLSFEGVFKEDDLFLIFYKETSEEEFSIEKTIKKKITGNDNKQKVILEFPKGVKPYDLRIDFSDNIQQEHVKFFNLTFFDIYNRLIFDKFNLDSFFAFNNYMTFQKKKSLLVGEVFKLNNKAAYNPYFIGNLKFKDVLKDFHEASLNKKTVTLINDLTNLKLDDGRFRFILTGTFEKDDLVLLYYCEDTISKFDLKQSLRLNVDGDPKEQTLIFTLPEGHYGVNFQLDISDDKKQTGIEINSIRIIEGYSYVNITKENFKEYFYSNDYVIFNKDLNSFSCKIIKANEKEKYNPYFVSSPKMIEELLSF